MDADSHGNFTWVYSQRNRLAASDLSRNASSCGRMRQYFELGYKRVWYSPRPFAKWLRRFHFAPFFYELIRRIISDNLEYRHLYAPVWLTSEISGLFCRNSVGPCILFPIAGSMRANSLTFNQLRDVLSAFADPQDAVISRCILSGDGFGVSM